MVLPAPDPGACRVCAGPTPARFALCFCCTSAVRQLQLPLAPVMVVAEYQVGDRLHRWLRGYKDAPVAEARRACAGRLAELVRVWLEANRGRLDERFGPGWDLVTTVPSTVRPGGCPADALVDRVPDLARRHRRLLARGPEPTGHLVAARRGFEVLAGVDRSWLRTQRVLVFDDSVTTGARAQSAVAALRKGGAQVVGVVAVGRAVGGVAGGARPTADRRSATGPELG
jgi:predicted amidophosphoribosyltransferase